MKKLPTLILYIFFALIVSNIFAVQPNADQELYWKILEKASLTFEKGNYGECLKYAISMSVAKQAAR